MLAVKEFAGTLANPSGTVVEGEGARLFCATGVALHSSSSSSFLHSDFTCPTPSQLKYFLSLLGFRHGVSLVLVILEIGLPFTILALSVLALSFFFVEAAERRCQCGMDSTTRVLRHEKQRTESQTSTVCQKNRPRLIKFDWNTRAQKKRMAHITHDDVFVWELVGHEPL